MRIEFQSHNLAVVGERAGEPERAVAAKRADFEDAARAGDADQQFEKLALQRRDVDGRKSGFVIGLEGGVECVVGWTSASAK